MCPLPEKRRGCGRGILPLGRGGFLADQPPAWVKWSHQGRRAQWAQSGRRATHTARPWRTIRWQKALLSSGGMV